MAKPKKPPPEPNPLVLEAMRPGIDVALRFGPKVREHIVYRGSREWMMTAEDPREATRLERAEAERLALYVAQQSPDLGRAALALSAAARYLAGTACVLHEQSDSREPASAPKAPGRDPCGPPTGGARGRREHSLPLPRDQRRVFDAPAWTRARVAVPAPV